jgi:hypothetical protein
MEYLGTPRFYAEPVVLPFSSTVIPAQPASKLPTSGWYTTESGPVAQLHRAAHS